MGIRESKLAKNTNYSHIATNLADLMDEGQKLGVSEGIQRVELICEQYKSLTPHTAYLWLDPSGFQREIEEAQTNTRWMHFVRGLRNIFSLAPLITTWIGLYEGVNAYQQYISTPGSNKQGSFLTLWQAGFDGRVLPFTVTALLDVVFLIGYLLLILYEQYLESQVMNKAAKYTKHLQSKVDELVTCVAEEGYPLITDQSDLDRAVNGIKSVVDSTTEALKQIVDHTVTSLNTMMEQNFKDFKQCLSDNSELVRTSIDGAAQTNATALEKVEQSLNVLLNTSHTTLKQYIDHATDTQNQGLVRFEHTLQTTLSNTSSTIQDMVDTATQSVTATHTNVERLMTNTVVPMMEGFHQDMASLHAELANYQGRINNLSQVGQELATAGQKLADASQNLIDNADRYVEVGDNINGQLAALNATQTEVLREMEGVAGGVTTAAGHMNIASTNMMNATQQIESLTTRLGANLDHTIEHMSRNLEYAHTQTNDTVKHLESEVNATIELTSKDLQKTSRTLAQVGPELVQSVKDLKQASKDLSEVEVSWPFRKRRSRGTVTAGGR
ncbi:hypothetical protein [Ktedonobacter racemifer]|uniref:Uncharacterized protein n=1 Tax=Ktedonobacter racemifer DSM 44963 TaxID=485913 RepID=D6U8K9_KTERA|nr:hypothetical protein [Ktedonobacter racemifer]EFH80220.1 hypothetical protein Krac_0799 [Ktedonobacter racemifer DSM 44963]